MRFGTRLLVALALVWSVLLGTATARRQALGPPRESSLVPAPAAAPGTAIPLPAGFVHDIGPSGDYVGSGACQRCHDLEHGQWERSLHVQMTRPVADATILGDFSGNTRLTAHGRSYEFGRKDGRPFVRVGIEDRQPETFAVDYTLGAKRYQGFLSTLPDGRIYVLPAFWHVEHRRWIDWKEITPIPDGAHDLRQIWNANCFNCHATNLVQGFDVATRQYRTTWTELGLGCEACHGPGREHVALAEAWEKDPARKPALDEGPPRDLTDVLKSLSTRSASPRRTYDTCAYCHGNKTNVFTGFQAGDRYEDYALPFLLSDEIPANDLQGEFWPDGRPNRFNRTQALTLSGCFQAGAIACTNCHVAHGARYEHSLKVNIRQGRYGDTLCTQCHQESRRAPEAAKASFTTGDGLRAHTFHAPESEGSRCINCHMSDVNWRMLVRRRDHTFRAPTPEMTARYGVPNACTTCHDDKTPEWAARQMDAWWGDGSRRKKEVAVADVMYRAGSGDPTVLPDLARVAVDRTQGSILRASAADYIARLLMGSSGGGQLSGRSQTSFVSGATGAAVPAPAVAERPVATTAIVNALLGAASDPEPVVRAMAVKALVASGQGERVMPALTARLVDAARVVRVKAAEGLLALGYVALPGPAGQALARAQEEYAASLEAFPDVASDHTALAWLNASRGRLQDAERSLDTAIQLAPEFPRPYLLKGILAARAGRFGEAIDWWKKARKRAPDDPAIPQLIAEAEKRKAGAR
jgi:predicted CXXCH cytochrome family protein